MSAYFHSITAKIFFYLMIINVSLNIENKREAKKKNFFNRVSSFTNRPLNIYSFIQLLFFLHRRTAAATTPKRDIKSRIEIDFHMEIFPLFILASSIATKSVWWCCDEKKKMNVYKGEEEEEKKAGRHGKINRI